MLVSVNREIPAKRSFDEIVGENIRAYRTAKDLSQAQLAEALSAQIGERIHQQTIQKIEKGLRPLKYAEAAAIAGILSVPYAVLENGKTQAVRNSAALRGMSRQLSDLTSELSELAQKITNVLVDLAFGLAAIRSYGPEDQPAKFEYENALSWLQNQWGQEFDTQLKDALRKNAWVSDIKPELNAETYHGVLEKISKLEMKRYQDEPDA